MVRFMAIKTVKTKLKQDQISKEFVCSSSTLQQYRQYINLLSPYRITQSSHNRREKISNTNHDDKSNREHESK